MRKGSGRAKSCLALSHTLIQGLTQIYKNYSDNIEHTHTHTHTHTHHHTHTHTHTHKIIHTHALILTQEHII